MTRLNPIIPTEHGAWAVIFVPLVIGASVTESFSPRVILLAGSMLGFFLSHVPLQTLLRRRLEGLRDAVVVRASMLWAGIYLGVGTIFLVPLLLSGYWMIVPLGAVGVAAFLLTVCLRSRIPGKFLVDQIAVLGLTVSAPAAYVVTSGSFDRTAVTLWILNALFFGGTVVYVHLKIRASAARNPRLAWSDKARLGTLNVLYHVLALSLVIFLVAVHYTPRLAIVAFVPMTIHSIYGTVRLSDKVRYKRLGIILVGQSILFAVVLTHAGF